MTTITGLTRGGAVWTPSFITALNQSKCIGCGRCFNVCSRDVFALVEREGVAEDDEDEDMFGDDDGFSDDTSMVMSLKDAMDCIGCQACLRVCPKKCLSHDDAAA
ncbi:MAG: ferredoxin III, nif-specific [Alphaproteobacteria bacterium RIFOXYD12_FULL_60_8]|nr:MAG: ferredoxin III, nif-specific [Alphaproteobacteria bacterium RIFOXYD12_FULL_60_8]